jgi:hypothetical protein
LKGEVLDSLVKLLEASCVVFEAELGQNLTLGVDGASDMEALGYIYADVDGHGKNSFSVVKVL